MPAGRENTVRHLRGKMNEPVKVGSLLPDLTAVTTTKRCDECGQDFEGLMFKRTVERAEREGWGWIRGLCDTCRPKVEARDAEITDKVTDDKRSTAPDLELPNRG